jgi:hypothetical protein
MMKTTNAFFFLQAIMRHGDRLVPSDMSEKNIFETSTILPKRSDEEDDDGDDNGILPCSGCLIEAHAMPS